MSNNNARTEREQALLLLETLPSVLGWVTAKLRREGPVKNPVHFQVLRVLKDSPVTLNELAKSIEVRLPTISRTVETLVSYGWIKRKPNERDRRSVRLEITAEGNKILKEVEDMAVKRIDFLLEGLTGREKEQVSRGLSILRKALAQKNSGERK
jgi:DNA-binding MarR family transcriptional regulator